METDVLAAIRARSFGREFWRSMLAKGGISLLGQYTGALLSGDVAGGKVKLDLIGLITDMTFTNGAGSLVGAIGEGGFEYTAYLPKTIIDCPIPLFGVKGASLMVNTEIGLHLKAIKLPCLSISFLKIQQELPQNAHVPLCKTYF